MRQKKFIIIAITLSLFIIALLSYLKLSYFFEIDACLDKGGSWDYENRKCNPDSFDSRVLEESMFSGGREFETNKKIEPKLYHFENYTFVIGFDSNQNSTLGLYYGNKGIFFPKHSDGFYDTVMLANLNNDGIQDFLVSYAFEDGATLYGLISNSVDTFKEVLLFEEWHENYCTTSDDTLVYIIPLQIKDINNDGKDDIINNLVKMNNKTFAIPCTDTVFSDKIE